MIIGISTGPETCLILGQVSHNLLYWKKNLPKNICGPGGDSFMARNLGENGKKRQAEGEAKVVE